MWRSYPELRDGRCRQPLFPITCAPPHDSVQNYAKLATWLCDCRPCLLRYRRYLKLCKRYQHVRTWYAQVRKLYANVSLEKKIMDHGLEVGKQIAFVLSGGNTNPNRDLSEDDLYNLELEAFMRLIQMPKTQERIKHTLETGKPLVN